MGEIHNSHTEKSKDNKSPYKDLHVYFLNGVFERDDESDFGSSYMGNWVEDEISFLFFSEPSLDLVNQAIELRRALPSKMSFIFPMRTGREGILAPSESQSF